MNTPRPAGTGHTPRRGVRVPDRIWNGAQHQAMLRGETVSAAVVRFLEMYAQGQDPTDRPRAPAPMQVFPPR